MSGRDRRRPGPGVLSAGRRRRRRGVSPEDATGLGLLLAVAVVPWWLGLVQIIGWITDALAAGIAP